MWNLLHRNFIIQYNSLSATTSLPGYKFATSTEPRWVKFFWHGVLCMCLYTVFFISLGFQDQYANSATLTVLEIVEQGTVLPYPSVYLCLGYPLHPEKLRNKSHELFANHNLSLPLDALTDYLQASVRFQRAAVNRTAGVNEFFSSNLNLTKIQEILPDLFYKPDEWLRDCSFKGLSYPCNTLFKPIETALGTCLVFNSIYTDKYFRQSPSDARFFTLTEINEDWSLQFKAFNLETAIMVYLKYPWDLLSLYDFPTFFWSKRKFFSNYHFAINNHYAEREIRRLTKSRRKCIFQDEMFPYQDLRNEFKTHFYNKGFCLSFCYAMEFHKRCNCLPAYIQNVLPNLSKKYKPTCWLKDVPCIERHYKEIREMNCEELCLANCNYTEYVSRPDSKMHNKRISEQLNVDYFELNIDLEYWPVLQCRSLVIFSFIEYLVSLMGLLGLIAGTSCLTFFEIFYGFLVRFPCSFYVNREHIKMEIQKQEQEERMHPLPCIDMSLNVPIRK